VRSALIYPEFLSVHSAGLLPAIWNFLDQILIIILLLSTYKLTVGRRYTELRSFVERVRVISTSVRYTSGDH
jgi:hypothetical protein